MMRVRFVLFSALLLALSGAALAANEAPVETWKVTFSQPGGQRMTGWLVKLQSKDGKWTGEVIDSRLPGATLDLSSADGVLLLTFKAGSQKFNLEAKAPQAGAKIMFGSMDFGGTRVPVELEPCASKSLDQYEMAKDTIARKSTGHEVIDAGTLLVSQAARKKASVEDVRNWADKALKAAEAYGPSMQRETAMRLAEEMGDKAFAAVGVEYARKAEQLLTDRSRPVERKQVLDALAEALKKAGKEEEAKEMAARSAKIELVKRETFPGRKGKSDRVVLVELFTGTQCPPCVAADLAFDAVAKTYKPGEVALLQYHEHIPGPDPLTNPDSEDRKKYYGAAFRGTPTILFNGKSQAGGGGNIDMAQDKYAAYYEVINPLLETPADAVLKASAIRKGSKIDITAEVADLKEPGEKMRLRLALVEEQVFYKGGNKLPTHHHVVRALPGGPNGWALAEKSAKQTATVDLEELRNNLKKYLDDYAAKGKPFPNQDRPLELKKLHVVAFIQNDDTKEVLQAVQVEVPGEEKEK